MSSLRLQSNVIFRACERGSISEEEVALIQVSLSKSTGIHEASLLYHG